MDLNVPVKTLELPGIFELVAARHEYDVVGGIVQLQGGHTYLEKADTVILTLSELVEETAEHTLFFVEQACASRRIVIPVENDLYLVRLERFERSVVLEKVRTGKTEHLADLPMARHDSQAAITVTILGGGGYPCGYECHFSGLPSSETDDT